jgi:predicted RNA binding protein YcfA (HicA-like mRNA interferase family)
MAIDYSQLRSLTAREIITALIRDGFFLRAQAGSHQRYRHPDWPAGDSVFPSPP